MRILALLVLLATAAPVRAAEPAPAPCKDTPLAWSALGAIFGGLVGMAMYGRGDTKPQTVYVGPAIVLGAGAGYLADRSCSNKPNERTAEHPIAGHPDARTFGHSITTAGMK